MDAPERIAVHDVMHRYALAVDTKDWNALLGVFCPQITADFRSFGVKEVYRGPREGWVAQVKPTLSGMDATQHLMANQLYAIEGDSARGTTYIQAQHVCRNEWGGDRYLIAGHYEVHMTRGAQGWQIADYTLRVTWTAGDRHVLRAARRRG